MVITEAGVKMHLIGLTPYVDAGAAEIGTTASAMYTDAILAAEADWERETRILLASRTIRMMPEAGVTADIVDDAMNLHHAFGTRNPRWQLRFRPVTEMLRCRFAWAAGNPIIDFPLSWLKCNLRLGLVNIVPYGQAAPGLMSANASAFLPFFGKSAWPGDMMPQMVAIDYKAGYTDAATNPDLGDLRDTVEQMAACHTLDHIQNAIPNAENLDGFSQSFDSVGDRIKRMTDEVQRRMAKFQSRERPLVVGVL